MKYRRQPNPTVFVVRSYSGARQCFLVFCFRSFALVCVFLFGDPSFSFSHPFWVTPYTPLFFLIHPVPVKRFPFECFSLWFFRFLPPLDHFSQFLVHPHRGVAPSFLRRTFDLARLLGLIPFFTLFVLLSHSSPNPQIPLAR